MRWTRRSIEILVARWVVVALATLKDVVSSFRGSSRFAVVPPWQLGDNAVSRFPFSPAKLARSRAFENVDGIAPG